ncbi:MAG TPA: SBBP repeat-containing protein, partial [Bryobacteraceae bacterium]|nr:SBBP repeat-containing protein [Bryobacteraceae bacterium]
MKWSAVGVSSAFLAVMCIPTAAAQDTRMHHYVGSDSSRWKIERSAAKATLASIPLAGSTSSIVYAGGDYPISIAKMAVDSAGNAYVIGNWLVTGAMYLPYLPLPPAIALSDIVVSKIDPSGAIAYVTHIGGKGNDTALGIAADSSGNVYGVGYTTSQDFPSRHAVQTMPGSPSTGFVFKLDSNGDLVWSTYFGGSGLGLLGGSVNAVAVDGAGNAYVTGISDQANLMTTAGAFQTTAIVRGNVLGPASSAFVAKFSPLGTLEYST